MRPVRAKRRRWLSRFGQPVAPPSLGWLECGKGRKYFRIFLPKARKCRAGRGFCRGKICFVNLNNGCADGIYISEFRCPFRVGRKVLLVVRFGQRIKVGLTTLLSALGEGVYDLITLRARVTLWLFFLTGSGGTATSSTEPRWQVRGLLPRWKRGICGEGRTTSTWLRTAFAGPLECQASPSPR